MPSPQPPLAPAPDTMPGGVLRVLDGTLRGCEFRLEPGRTLLIIDRAETLTGLDSLPNDALLLPCEHGSGRYELLLGSALQLRDLDSVSGHARQLAPGRRERVGGLHIAWRRADTDWNPQALRPQRSVWLRRGAIALLATSALGSVAMVGSDGIAPAVSSVVRPAPASSLQVQPASPAVIDALARAATQQLQLQLLPAALHGEGARSTIVVRGALDDAQLARLRTSLEQWRRQPGGAQLQVVVDLQDQRPLARSFERGDVAYQKPSSEHWLFDQPVSGER